MTYTVTVTLSVDAQAEHLHSEQEIASEVRSWLEGLGAVVHTVDVREEEEAK